MAVKTGYKKDEVAALQGRIALGRAALRTHLPDAPLGNIHLVCCCSNCMEDSVFAGLCKTPMSALTPQQISYYFGGAGVLAQDTGSDARQEAFGIYLHVLDALAEAVLADKTVERDYVRAWDFVEPNYWHEPLYSTGFLDDLTPPQRAIIAELLTDMVELGIARNLPRMTDALIFLSRATDAFANVLQGIMKRPSRRQLAFWVAVAGWTPNSPAGLKNAGVSDFARDFSFMRDKDRHLMEDALADPEVEILLDRYAFAARDREWLGFMSRLVAWRENTVQRNEMSRGKPARW